MRLTNASACSAARSTQCRWRAPQAASSTSTRAAPRRGLLGRVIVRNEQRSGRVARAKRQMLLSNCSNSAFPLPLVDAFPVSGPGARSACASAGFVDCSRAAFDCQVTHSVRPIGRGHQQQRGADRPELGGKTPLTLAWHRHCTGDPTRAPPGHVRGLSHPWDTQGKVADPADRACRQRMPANP